MAMRRNRIRLLITFLAGVVAAGAAGGLAKEERGIEEVAFLLRFSDPSAFTKAFRRWTGQTPADYVRAHKR